MCTTGSPDPWLLVHQGQWEDVSRLRHLSMSTEMPLHVLFLGESSEFSYWGKAAVN